MVTNKYKKRKRRLKQLWSDNTIYETKRNLNKLGNNIKHNTNNNDMKQRYFHLFSNFKKMVKQKKIQYQKKIFDTLSEKYNSNPQEYWKILKSFKNGVTEDEEIPEILNNEEKLIKHFQQQGNPFKINTELKEKIENTLKKLEEKLKENPETDRPITFGEIKNVIKNLKTGKAAGPDRIINEVIKCSHTVIINCILKMFNLILKVGKYPKSWRESFLTPIHKSGDKKDPNNYRGVSLINSLAKMFNAILNNRLTGILRDFLSNNQFGFRKDHRTADSIFVLKSLINKYLHKNKKKIYACFVDLKKAFDSVWRDGLLYKLYEVGVGIKFFNIVKDQYEKTISSLKYKNCYSEFFKIERGVKQGDSLSPTLFNIFINDITSIFEKNYCNPLQMIEMKIGSLLFADDLLILSETKHGLQNSLR